MNADQSNSHTTMYALLNCNVEKKPYKYTARKLYSQSSSGIESTTGREREKKIYTNHHIRAYNWFYAYCFPLF